MTKDNERFLCPACSELITMYSVIWCLLHSYALALLEPLSAISQNLFSNFDPGISRENSSSRKQPLTPYQLECLDRVTKTGKELRSLVLRKKYPHIQVSRRSQEGEECECIFCYDRHIDDFSHFVPKTKVVQYSSDDDSGSDEDCEININNLPSQNYVKIEPFSSFTKIANKYLSKYTRKETPTQNFSLDTEPIEPNYFAYCLTQEESSLPEDRQFNFARSKEMKRQLPSTEDYAKAALVSRYLVFRILPHHNNDGFRFTPEEDYGTVVDKFINNTLSGLSNWDGQYFLHIATKGYTDEYFMAFFPLFPMTVSSISQIFYPIMFPFMSFSSVVLVVGLALNCILFLKSVEILRDITKRCDRGLDNLMDFVVLLYCYNPASIFYTAFYTESMFSYLTISVFHSLLTRNTLKAAIMASMSAICRSNGILNFGFIAAYIIRNALCEAIPLRKDKHESRIAGVVVGFVMIAVGMIPFSIFQMYGMHTFCNGIDVSDLPPYCLSALTMPYQYVQKRYWNVGFLNYFEPKQIPNFLLAAPVLCVTLYECVKRLRLYLWYIIDNRYYDCIGDLSMTLHGVFLVFFCFLCIHVQVSTRLILSACPYLFIYIAKSHRLEVCRYRKKEVDFPFFSSFIFCWSFGYYIVGTIMFPLGLPWT